MTDDDDEACFLCGEYACDGDCTADKGDDLGFHVIGGTHLLELLKRCQDGEDADMVFAELWANAEHVRNDEYNPGLLPDEEGYVSPVDACSCHPEGEPLPGGPSAHPEDDSDWLRIKRDRCPVHGAPR